ncbi:protein white-like isoform X1 [Amphibalanus amphitrite]|uniref:protein white-like isoform X1 n=2 Tax=Amphibalanus amphitrite TaxID=1232801 RepID=UPI001C91A661|nr:protein white-like isoform X1 [Amphibalanus amphitrite]XP_043198379.1 protein white-like isoform X1 [Amphibalanus amphitrite]XP_043198380.1 protein white-like isoform X1 [Amphibalanus amphitrite]XP_043198381.1 protein white-like isoform X1 [Amphibalanus amphitrite]XP_043198382.1 protein white-like isoform X1 [Amphibalanus amphitrite]XP_043198383.1 protein white-like isoform X1 [Amphibalanus amphitrite]
MAGGIDNKAFDAIQDGGAGSSTGHKSAISSVGSTAVMVTPEKYQQATYAWDQINVYTRVSKSRFSFGKSQPKERKHILKDVRGVVHPGEFVAIMGASGAGKTTLLNVLTFRNLRGLKVTGGRTINGETTNLSSIKKIGAYVQQDDLMIGTLTVREHLRFQALLRMDSHVPYEARMKRVADVIQDLGLTKCADTVIGSPSLGKKGISGGEMKRLSFACEVITDPPLMLCDEPTSGLDSFMAQNVVAVLKTLAERGKTVICTIHQPSSEVYAMFDRVLLMAEGRVAYMGDVDGAYDFFREVGYACPTNFNPADFFIQTMAIVPGNEEQCRQRVDKIATRFQECKLGQDISKEAGKLVQSITSGNSADVDTDASYRSDYKAGWWSQFKAVFWRSVISNIREPMVLKVKIIQTVFISLLFGVIYLGQELNQEGVMNINGALFLFLTNMTFQNVFSVVNVFCLELPIFMREHGNGMYRTDVYFLAKTLAELPLYIIFPAVFVAISYFMMGLNSDVTAFFICVGIVILVANCAASFGYMTSCSSSSVNVALAITAPAIIPFMLFGGFFLNSGSVPVWLEWLQYLSWFNYANEALCINQWQNIDHIDCGGSPACPSNGTVVLETLSYSVDNFNVDIGALAALLVGYRLLAYLILLFKSYRHE